MRLGRSRAAAAEVAAPEDEQKSTPYERLAERDRCALVVLLEAGIIDVAEFQAMRAWIGATAAR